MIIKLPYLALAYLDLPSLLTQTPARLHYYYSSLATDYSTTTTILARQSTAADASFLEQEKTSACAKLFPEPRINSNNQL